MACEDSKTVLLCDTIVQVIEAGFKAISQVTRAYGMHYERYKTARCGLVSLSCELVHDPQEAALHHRLSAEWLCVCYILLTAELQLILNNCMLNSDIKLIGELNFVVSSKIC